jgi:hypothetical protein
MSVCPRCQSTSICHDKALGDWCRDCGSVVAASQRMNEPAGWRMPPRRYIVVTAVAFVILCVIVVARPRSSHTVARTAASEAAPTDRGRTPEQVSAIRDFMPYIGSVKPTIKLGDSVQEIRRKYPGIRHDPVSDNYIVRHTTDGLGEIGHALIPGFRGTLGFRDGKLIRLSFFNEFWNHGETTCGQKECRALIQDLRRQFGPPTGESRFPDTERDLDLYSARWTCPEADRDILLRVVGSSRDVIDRCYPHTDSHPVRRREDDCW